MKKVSYNKPALTYEQQLQQLRDRGLIIKDEKFLLHLLETKSYYRLSGYWYPLLANKQNHVFKNRANFSSAFNMYCFDRKLRQIVMNELEKIEVCVRAKMIYIMSHRFGSFWYTDRNLFYNGKDHFTTLDKITSEFSRSDAQFIKAFKNKYSETLPPCWSAFEIVSFGSISKLYANLKPGMSKRNIANYFGLDEKTFTSWLHSFVYVRNVCAHHSRLWNRVMRIQPVNPRSPKNNWLLNRDILNNRTYYILSMMLYLLQTVAPNNHMAQKIRTLFERYRNIDPAALGFPVNWDKETLWETSSFNIN